MTVRPAMTDAAPTRIVRVSVTNTDAGDCPLCGFHSLRRYQGFTMNLSGVTTVYDQKHCGRCLIDLRESMTDA